MRRWLLGLPLSMLLSGSVLAADLYGGQSDLPDEVRTLLQASDPQRRKEGIERLQALPQRLSSPYLVQRLHDGEPMVRARAAQALGPIGSLAAIGPLLAGMSDADSTVRAASAEAIGQYGALPKAEQQRAIALLARAMGDGQFEVRQEALRAVERLLFSQVITVADLPPLMGPLLLRAEDENVSVRRCAMAVLGRLSPLSLSADQRGRVLLSLLGRLSDPARDVRAESLRSLGLLRADSAIPAALRLLRDPSDEVRKQAMLCLGRLSAESAIPLLRETLETGSDSQRASAVQALSFYLLPTSPKRLSADVLALATQAILTSLGNPALRPLVVEALVAAGDRVGPILLQELARPALDLAQLATLIELVRDLGNKLPPPDRRTAEQVLSRELSQNRVPKELLLDALAAVGDRNTAALFASLLADKDVIVRRRAVQLLRKPNLLDVRAKDALLAATSDADPHVQRQALLALGDLQQGQARLCEVLDPTDRPALPDAETRLAAVLTMQTLTSNSALDEKSVSILVRAVLTMRPGEDERRIRRRSAQALASQLGPHPEKQGPIVAELLQALRKPPDGGPHSEVLLLLSGLLRGHGSETVRERLMALSQLGAEPHSAEGQLAVDALAALQSFVDLPAQSRLIRLLSHGDPLRVNRATAALGVLLSATPTENAISALVAQLSDGGDLRTLAETAWALSNLPRNHPACGRVVERLRAMLQIRRESSPDLTALRCNVLGALARLGAAETSDLQWLDDPDPGIRRNAALLAGLLVPRAGTVESRLRSASASDEDRAVRQNAKAALLGQGAHGHLSRKHWIITYQFDLDGKPRSFLPYRLVMGDGINRVGYTDRTGTAVDEHLPDGDNEVELIAPPVTPR